MYAVIKAGGHQYKVSQGDELTIDYHEGKEGDKLTFDKVLMVKGETTVTGSPFVDGAQVEVEITKQLRDSKVLVFKYKRRKNYKRTKGHKQNLTMVKVNRISN